MIKAAEIFSTDLLTSTPDELFPAISRCYNIDEADWLEQLLTVLDVSAEQEHFIAERATALISAVRDSDQGLHIVDALLLQYSLNTQEGVLLMCLAEALMRIPDSATADALIRDKLTVADWKKHLHQSNSLLVNASTWGLMFTGKVLRLDQSDGSASGVIDRLVSKMGEPLIRTAIHQAMTIMAKHFVLGHTIKDALNNGKKALAQGYCYSFDMLGEAALTTDDARRYWQNYRHAIETLGQQTGRWQGRATLSIKLSALHPRYEAHQEHRVLTELYHDVLDLITTARALDVAITIDAEEADRLELSLKLFEKLYRSDPCRGWGGLGLVVQAYSKRALPTLCWLAALAKEQGDIIPLRLVKGAYWDSEIKHCQQLGLTGYPVYTRKEATDVAYLACAKYLLSAPVRDLIAAQFATHNAHTVAAILAMANGWHDFEFQRLHGMGDSLYQQILATEGIDVRIYAPVGSHQDLLPYLVRRLLENGANSSFVHRLIDAKTPIADLVHHPATLLRDHSMLPNPLIPLPTTIFSDERRNSSGINIAVDSQWLPLAQQLDDYYRQQWQQGSIIAGERCTTGDGIPVFAPYDHQQQVGTVYWATTTEQAMVSAAGAFDRWNTTPVDERASCLERLSDLLEEHHVELIALCQMEAGKTIQAAIDEIREAVDFCRYYAQQARRLFVEQTLPGPTGESNQLHLTGRGVFACISPWNFPVAIFVGQIAAALVTGNTVVAKPAETTSLIAARVTELILAAGVPGDVIQLVLGEGAVIGAELTSDPRLAGVVFTGSTATAHHINRNLAARATAIAPLIAETGGQNAMIVDSTALPEQVVHDVITSAFDSAGQRCSALRVLYVQADIADDIIVLIKGAMAELTVSDPRLRNTDIGPVIDHTAQTQLQAHIDELSTHATLLAQTKLPTEHQRGTFIAPTMFEIPSIKTLQQEHFGPILHVVRYAAKDLDQVIDDINNTGFGLTLGIHSRNESTAHHIDQHVKVGNVYINRNQIGAVVGVQPFGGQGLSGTGPKAGGPHYLLRFVNERTRTINTASIGGNASLLSLGEE